MRSFWIASAISLALAAAPLHSAVLGADTFTITFEPTPPELLPGVFRGEFPQLGLNLSGGIVTPDGGVNGIFRGIRILQTTEAISPPNIALPLGFDPEDRPIGMVGFFFRPTFTQDQTAATDMLSFFVVDTEEGGSQWTVEIFGGTDSVFNRDNLLESISGTTDAHIVFSRPMRDITGFTFVTSATDVGIDNLAFNEPQVPEPGTMYLLCSALLAVAAPRLHGLVAGRR